MRTEYEILAWNSSITGRHKQTTKKKRCLNYHCHHLARWWIQRPQYWRPQKHIMANLLKEHEEHKRLTFKNNLMVSWARVPGTTPLWISLYSWQEKKLLVFQLIVCLRKIVGTALNDGVTKTQKPERANRRSVTSLLCKRELSWLDHVKRKDISAMPK